MDLAEDRRFQTRFECRARELGHHWWRASRCVTELGRRPATDARRRWRAVAAVAAHHPHPRIATFVEVGEALLRIRDGRLYRDSYATFEDYCRDRWGFGERRGRQLIEAAEVGTIVPVKNEGQARELAPLRDDPNAMREPYRKGDRTGPTTVAVPFR